MNPSMLSAVGKGKQKETTTVTPTVTVFLPKSLGQTLIEYPKANLIIGWCIPGGPGQEKVFIVVAGLISPRQSAHLQSNLAYKTLDPTTPASVLGSCKRAVEEKSSIAVNDSKGEQGEAWIEIGVPDCHDLDGRRSKLPEIIGLKAPVMCSSTAQCAINVVYYTIPRADRMRYLNLEPMELPAASSAGVLDRFIPEAIDFKREAIDFKREGELQTRLEALIRLDPMRHHELASSFAPGRAPGEGFRRAIMKLNQTSYLNEAIASGSSVKLNGIHTQPAAPLLDVFFSLIRFSRSICQAARSILNAKMRKVALTDFSATARQLDLRLGQCIIWPSLGLQLRRRRLREHQPVSNLAPRYVALYNGVWLVINDIILGQTLGIWLCENHEKAADFIARWMRPVLVTGLIDTLTWLDNWPAGLKLNTQLSHFFRDMFVGLTTAWNDLIISQVAAGDHHILSKTIYIMGLSSRLMGLTMLISIIVDLLQLFTLHWMLYYRIQQVIFQFFSSSIISLFHLFRGKKRNPLRRNRIDKATYELDQLLLGTIFFTLFVFLFLTVAVYYLHFSLLRLAIVGIITALQTGLAILNHLPLFALMLRIKEPDRLPGGVELRLLSNDEVKVHNPLHCSYFELQSTPLGLQDIFRGYHSHLQAIRNLPHLLWRLLLGRRF